MFKFQPEVETILRQSGWTPDRSVDASRWIEPLLKEGFTINHPARRILESLGGLTITPMPSDDNLFFPSEIVLDPYSAASGEHDHVAKWEQDFGLSLFPIGEYDPLFLLLVDPNGGVYGGREQTFLGLGDSIADALELKTLARRRPTILRK